MDNKEDKYNREDDDISVMTMTSTVTVIMVEMTMKLYRNASRAKIASATHQQNGCSLHLCGYFL
jgi:hypothetical protein